MKQTVLFLGMVILLLCAVTVAPAQTVVQVAPGVDGINTAIRAAAPGTIIELTGGTDPYIETADDTIAVDITIRAASGLAQKPVIVGGPTNAVFHLLTGSLTLKGIKIDGAPGGTPYTGANFIYLKAPPTGTSTPFNLKIDNCEFVNCMNQRMVTTSDGDSTALDSVIVTNSIFKNSYKSFFYLKATRGGSKLYPGAYKYCLIENCLMIRTSASSGDGHATYLEPGNRDDGTQPFPKLIVRHVTVDSTNSGGINTYTTSDALVENCIVTNIKDTATYSYLLESGRWAGAPPTHMNNSLYYQAPGKLNRGINRGNSSYSLAVVTNTMANVDPMFVNPTAGDYSLQAGSPAKGAGTDGKDLGFVPGGLTAIRETGGMPPETFGLSQNYPNPFNPSTTIDFSVPKSGRYSIKVFNMLGQEVATVFDQEVTPGNYTTQFSAKDLASGVYIYRLKGTSVVMTKSMLLLK